MISAEAPMLFAKACEMFILELTLRSWYQTEESKLRTLQRSDVEDAVHGTEIFDFLIDAVPRQSAVSSQQQQKPTPVQPTRPPASARAASDTADIAGTTEEAGAEAAANAQGLRREPHEGADAAAGASSSDGAAIKTEDAAGSPSDDGSDGGDANSSGGQATG